MVLKFKNSYTLSQQAHFSRRLAPEVAAATYSAIQKIVEQVEVPVNTILGNAQLSLEDIMNLQVGDIIPLNTSPHQPLTLDIGGLPRFQVQVGRRRESHAVQLLNFVSKREKQPNTS